MIPKLVLVDMNPQLVTAWRSSFEENPEAEIVQGSLLDQQVDAWAVPTNAQGRMTGGIDRIVNEHLGGRIEPELRRLIREKYLGLMPMGQALCVPTGDSAPKYVIATPTRSTKQKNVHDVFPVALACAASLQTAIKLNERSPGSIGSLAMPGLGTGAGGMPVEVCADLMWTAYDLLKEESFVGHDELVEALEDRLGEMRTKPKRTTPSPQVNNPGFQAPPTPSTKAEDIDFDDAE